MDAEQKKKYSSLLKNSSSTVTSIRSFGSGAIRKNPLRNSALMLNYSGGHHAKLGEFTAELYKDKSMTDVMVVVQAKEFKTHKNVLACYSPYFKDVLDKPGFNEVHYLQIPSVTAKAFEILLDHMYTGELKVNCQDLCEVYRSAKKLGMSGAISRCKELLNVTQENFQNTVYLYVTARKLDLLDASARGFRMMVQNFEQLATTKEFLDLELEQVLELFSTDEIGARSEIIVFMAALSWLDYDFFEREEHVESIFACVRFSLMSPEEILACYHPFILPGLMVKPAIRQTLLNATCYITAKSLGQESLFSELASKPRTFLFGGEPTVLWDLSIFDPDKYEVTKRHKAAIKIQARFRGYITRKKLKRQIMDVHRAATIIQAAYRGYRVRKHVNLTKIRMKKKGKCTKNYLLHLDRRSGTIKAYSKRTFEVFQLDLEPKEHAVIYAMTVFDEQKEEGNTLFSFDTQDGKCNILGKCLIPSCDSRMIYYDEHLYILGGFNPLIGSGSGQMLPSKAFYRYYVSTGEWRTMPDMREVRCSHAAAVLNEEILAIGGKNEENRILSSIERYDMSVGKWKKFSISLPEPRMAMGCTIHRGMLWIAGGITCEDNNIHMMDSVWCLDNKTYRWAKKVNLPQPLALPTLMSDGKDLFCVGGMTTSPGGESESTNKIYKYDIREWVEQSPLPFEAHSIVGYKVGKSLYIFGGFSSQRMSHIQEKVRIHLNEEETTYITLASLEEPGHIAEAAVSWQ